MNIINEIIYPVLQEFKETEGLDIELSPELVIFGDGSEFDSLTLVRFIIGIQEQILDLTDKTVLNKNKKINDIRKMWQLTNTTIYL